MQYYVYDFSEFLDFHVNQSGRFGDYPGLDNYWIKKTHFPYLLEFEGKHAGFALVNFKESEDKAYFTIAEFFIMKKYRKNGFGRTAAHQIFDRCTEAIGKCFRSRKTRLPKLFGEKLLVSIQTEITQSGLTIKEARFRNLIIYLKSKVGKQ